MRGSGGRRASHWSVQEGWRGGVKVAVEAGFNQRAVMGSHAIRACVCARTCVRVRAPL